MKQILKMVSPVIVVATVLQCQIAHGSAESDSQVTTIMSATGNAGLTISNVKATALSENAATILNDDEFENGTKPAAKIFPDSVAFKSNGSSGDVDLKLDIKPCTDYVPDTNAFLNPGFEGLDCRISSFGLDLFRRNRRIDRWRSVEHRRIPRDLSYMEW